MKKILAISIFLANYFIGNAQTKEPGIPISIQLSLSNSNVANLALPPIDVEQILLNDTCTDCGKLIGWDIPYYINFLDQSTSEFVNFEGELYEIKRIIIYTDSSYGLKVHFSNFHLNSNEKVYFYNPDNTSQINGGFTSKWNRTDNSFISDDIIGNRIMVEVNRRISIDTITQNTTKLEGNGFIFLFKQRFGFGQALACHQNVICQPEFDEFCNEIRSVIKLRRLKEGTQGFFSCSGTLLNNTRNDFDPLVLTAEHCTSFPRDMNLWEVYFNFQSQTCSPSTIGNDQMRLVGLSRIGVDDGDNVACPDFAMLRLDNPIPIQYNAFFAGWNKRAWSSLPSNKNVAGIHHPAGDIKKITLGHVTNAPYTSCIKAHWAHGTGTEGGSSGSPIFLEQTKEYIGALSGGLDMECDEDNNDYYSFLHTANGDIQNPLNPDFIDALTWGGIDPITACQPGLFLDGVAFPGSDWQNKNQIEIQAAAMIVIAANEETIISNSPSITLPAVLPVANADYLIKAGQRILIEPGFRINAPERNPGGFYSTTFLNGSQNRVSFRIEPCHAFVPQCGINHSSLVVPINKNPNNNSSLSSKLGFNFEIYPNPNTGSFTVEINDETKNSVSLILMDITGKRILSSQISVGQTKTLIETSNLSNGVYLLLLKTSEKQTTQNMYRQSL